MLDWYWWAFVGSEWKHYIYKWEPDGSQHYMTATVFFSDLSEFVRIIFLFLILMIGEQKRTLFRFNAFQKERHFSMWWGYLFYMLVSIIDFWFYQSQSSLLGFRVWGSAILMTLEVVYLYKWKEDEL